MFLNKKITLAIVSALSVSAVSASEVAATDTIKTESKKAEEVSGEYAGFDKFRFGGYGEMLANFLDYGPNRWTGTSGAPKEKRGEISIPRFVVAFDYKFTSKWILGVEVEFEAGGTGTAVDANNEACVEILRQIRLKGLGGQMIVDFAGNKEKKFLLKMMDRLNSPAVFVKGFSSLGLVELVVEKRKSSLFDVFDESRKHYRTAADLIRKLWFASSRGALSVYAPLPVLNYIRPYLSRLEERLKIDVNLYASEYIRLEGLKE